MGSDASPEIDGTGGLRANESSYVRLAEEPARRVGPILIEPALRRISHADRGEAVVEPRVMQVLVVLLRTPGEVVSHDRLFDLCWNGVIVGDDAISRAISRLRGATAELSRGVFRIETVARVGHRLVLEISPEPFAIETVSRVGDVPQARPAAEEGAPGPRRFRMKLAVAGFLALAVLALTMGIGWFRNDRAEAVPVAIAVLPFRNLSEGNDHFADGIAEEILSQLAREPQLRVAGRTSSSLFRNRAADLRDVGRRLNVAYVLEGSVRRAGDRVRVDVALVATRDGMRLWSRGFQGRLDDIFAIQSEIGREVTGALRLRFAAADPMPPPMRTSGEVYSLYLTARGIMRTRSRENIETAQILLRRAIRLDPDFAPAWSSLAQAIRLTLRPDLIARDSEALRYANHALALAPDLAEAHAVKGMILGSAPEAVAHLERAVQLNPNHAEAWLWLGNARVERGDYAGSLRARQRVAEIDPFWINGTGFSKDAWGMRRQAEAIRFEENLAANHPEASHRELARARMAGFRGDWSGSALHFRRAAELDSGDSAFQIRNQMAQILLLLDLPTEFSGNAGREERVRGRPIVALWRTVMDGEMPTRAAIVATLGRPTQFWSMEGWNLTASRLLLNKGRAADLVFFYDSAFASPEAMDAGIGEVASLHGFASLAPNVAIALRETGRGAEADRLLALADRRACRTASIVFLPTQDMVNCSRIWAVQGRRGAAMDALQRAAASGWPIGFLPDQDWHPRPDIVAEPAWRSIRDEPQLRRIDAGIRARLARERGELVAALAGRQPGR